MSIHKSVKNLSIIIPFILLAACGGGNNAAVPTVNTISGIAADGYLRDAVVCLDINNNGGCDEGEPSAITGQGGVFTLDPGGYDTSAYPVVVEVNSDTVDEDSGQTVDVGYTLRAPAGNYGFITPLTTLVQSTIDQNPALDAESAAQIIGQQLNVVEPDKLYTDYVAGAADAELDDLHRSAQMVARAFGEIRESLIGRDLIGNLQEDHELRAVQVLTGKLLLRKARPSGSSRTGRRGQGSGPCSRCNKRRRFARCGGNH